MRVMVIVKASKDTVGVCARAQPSEADAALAQSLFEEGTALMKQGRFDDACPKLAESQRLDPGGGTVLNLAVCLEKSQRYASAYLAYHEALAIAERDENKGREAIARDRLAMIGPLVPHVTIHVAPAVASLEGLEVRFDTANVRRAAWGVAAPVDAGEHVVSVTAPGKREWKRSFTIAKPGAEVRIDVPRLEDLPPPLVTPVPPKVETPRLSTTQRDVGWALAATGAAAGVVGIVTGSAAVVRYEDSKRFCDASRSCTREGVAATRDADALAWAANISFGVALLSAGVGAALVLTAPRSPKIAAGLGAITWEARF